jgi:hypothetical protein
MTAGALTFSGRWFSHTRTCGHGVSRLRPQILLGAIRLDLAVHEEPADGSQCDQEKFLHRATSSFLDVRDLCRPTIHTARYRSVTCFPSATAPEKHFRNVQPASTTRCPGRPPGNSAVRGRSTAVRCVRHPQLGEHIPGGLEASSDGKCVEVKVPAFLPYEYKGGYCKWVRRALRRNRETHVGYGKLYRTDHPGAGRSGAGRRQERRPGRARGPGASRL